MDAIDYMQALELARMQPQRCADLPYACVRVEDPQVQRPVDYRERADLVKRVTGEW